VTTPDGGALALDIALRPRDRTDLPILLALRDLEPRLTSGVGVRQCTERTVSDLVTV
jgi:hypothetical protein